MAMMMVMKSFKKADLSDHKDLKNARVSAMDESENSVSPIKETSENKPK